MKPALALSLSTLAVVGVAVLGAGVAGGLRPDARGVEVAEPVRGGPSCEERALDAPPDSSLDWANYLRWQDRVYVARLEPEPALVPAQQLGTVVCTRSGSRTPVDHVIADGEAAYLDVGTPFHAVQGRDPREAVTAVFNGQRLVFTVDRQLTTALVEAQRPVSDVLRIREQEVLGAQVCKADTTVDVPNTECRQLEEGAARRVAGALDGSPPYGPIGICTEDGPVYRVAFVQPASRGLTVVVPSACGPATVGDRRFRVDERDVRVVVEEHDGAGAAR